MKFLEDESETEDWFVALDEAMLEATQPKKPRTSLQRYKSMPSNTITTDANVGNISVSSSLTTKPSSSTSSSSLNGNVLGSSKMDTPGIKRHASSHALSPAISNGKWCEYNIGFVKIYSFYVFLARSNLFGRRK